MNTHAPTRSRALGLPLRRSVLALAAALAALPASQAQSVQTGGDISPLPAFNPQAAWDLGAAELIVGNTGAGSLVIADGGSVTGDGSADIRDFLKSSTIGLTSGSSGTATVTGAGSLWAMSHSLRVGHQGSGTLTVADGGSIISGIDGVVGDGFLNSAGSRGTATITGTGSSWTAGYNFYVGISGTGSLTVANGARITNGTHDADMGVNLGDGYIGYDNGSRGAVTITGPGSTWENRGELILGGYATDPEAAATDAVGTLNIQNGGTVTVGGTVRVHSGSTLAVEVTGSAPALTAGGDLSNGGVVRLTAGHGVAAGSYTPLAVAGELTGDGQYQAVGGTWDASTRLFTVAEAEQVFSGETATIDLTDTQRITTTGLGSVVTTSFGAGYTTLGGGSVIEFTATEATGVTQIGGKSVLTAWDFGTDLDMTAGFLTPVDLTFTLDTSALETGISSESLSVYHRLNPYSNWDLMNTSVIVGKIIDLTSLTLTVNGFSGYAIVVTPVPEPASVAALAGLGALGLATLRRRRGA